MTAAKSPSPPPDPRPIEPTPIDERSDDERGIGWGEDPDDGRRDADWYRRERPPHHE